jgi:hypothetical protein
MQARTDFFTSFYIAWCRLKVVIEIVVSNRSSPIFNVCSSEQCVSAEKFQRLVKSSLQIPSNRSND